MWNCLYDLHVLVLNLASILKHLGSRCYSRTAWHLLAMRFGKPWAANCKLETCTQAVVHVFKNDFKSQLWWWRVVWQLPVTSCAHLCLVHDLTCCVHAGLLGSRESKMEEHRACNSFHEVWWSACSSLCWGQVGTCSATHFVSFLNTHARILNLRCILA